MDAKGRATFDQFVTKTCMGQGQSQPNKQHGPSSFLSHGELTELSQRHASRIFCPSKLEQNAMHMSILKTFAI